MGYKPTHGFQSNVQSLNYFFSNASLCVQLSKFMKVVELVEVQIMGFVKDEKTFSTLTSMETRLCNQPYEHLDLVVCMFA
jgi:hypothetical protein